MPTSKDGGLSPTAQHFLESVLQLRPQVAAFDCDGTLWSGDAGETFFDWEIKRGVVTPEVARAVRARYAEYKAGNVSEDDMCGEMVTMHEKLPQAVVIEAATEFMSSAFPGRVFPEMQELVNRLHDTECEIWAVSSSNEWVIRAGLQQFGIPHDRILAAKVEVDGNLITNRLVRVPSGPGKSKVLREVVNKTVDAAFGNSKWDIDMLAHARHAFAVNPNPDLEALARQRGWTVYFPDGIARPPASCTAVPQSAGRGQSPADEAGGPAN
jgi:HAD superfamily phosphoserine phosphatase-like hydrolase